MGILRSNTCGLFFVQKKLLPLVKTMYVRIIIYILQANLHGEKENNMYKGINKKPLITTSSAEHRITRPHTLNVSLIKLKFSIDILQSLHVAAPIYMLGTLGGNNQRGG